MIKMRDSFLFFFSFILIFNVSLVFSLSLESCEEYGIDESLCSRLEIRAGDSSKTEDELILETLSQGDLDTLYKRTSDLNYAVNFNKGTPNGLSSRSSRLYVDSVDTGVDTIDNAWVKIFAVMPSFEEDGVRYVTDQINYVIGYNFDVNVPSALGKSKNYKKRQKENPSPPSYENKYGDCRTEFELKNGEYLLHYSLNGVVLDKFEEMFVDVNNISGGLILNPDSNKMGIRGILGQEFEIKHYSWEDDGTEKVIKCVGSGESRSCYTITYYIFKCEYDYSTHGEVSLTLQDEIDFVQYEPPEDEHKIFFASDGKINYGDFESDSENFEVFFGKGILSRDKTKYELKTRHEPYDIFYVDKLSADYFYVAEVDVTGGDDKKVLFMIPEYNLDECYIEYRYPFTFYNQVEDCRVSTKKFSSVSVLPVEKYYKPGDEVEFEIFLKADGREYDDKVEVVYGDEKKVVYLNGGKGRVSFVGKDNVNKVEVLYGGDSRTTSAKIISDDFVVADKGFRDLLWIGSVMFIIVCVVYIIKKWTLGNLK